MMGLCPKHYGGHYILQSSTTTIVTMKTLRTWRLAGRDHRHLHQLEMRLWPRPQRLQTHLHFPSAQRLQELARLRLQLHVSQFFISFYSEFYIWASTDIHTLTGIHTHTHTYTRIHTHTHTYKHTRAWSSKQHKQLLWAPQLPGDP